MIPGEFFILKFDFSTIDRSPDIAIARRSLIKSLITSFEVFYDTYAQYLGGKFTDLCENIHYEDPNVTLKMCVFLVQKTLEQREHKQLSNVKGVSIHLAAYLIHWLLIALKVGHSDN